MKCIKKMNDFVLGILMILLSAFLVFGKETRGLPEELLHDHYDRCIRIPMVEGARSLNLANSVAVVLYEALRQNDFESLNRCGHLTQYETES